MTLPRYQAYKDSGSAWLGQIPSHWERRRIKTLLTESTDAIKIGPFGSQLTSDMLTLTGYKVYGQENVIAQDFADRGTRFISSDKFSELAVYSVVPGDLLISMMGTSGRCAIVPENAAAGVMDSHLLRLRLAQNICPRFFQRLIDEADYVAHQVLTFGKGSIMHGLNSGIVQNLLLAVPPVEEQVAINALLDREIGKLDALIAEQAKLIALLAEKRQATISHAVTRGLNPDAPTKDSGVAWLGAVPEHWQIRRLKTVSRFTTSGPRGWSGRVGDQGSLFVQSGDLNDALEIEFASAKRVAVEDDAEAERTALADGDVVVCITGARTGNVAVCTTIPEPAYVNQHLCLVRPNADVLPLFLGGVLKSRIGQTQFELSQYGLKQGLSLESIREVLLAVPPLEEQRSLVAHMETEGSKLNRLATEAERAITLLKERRSALIAAAVTGQIDVRAQVRAPTAEPALALA